MYSTIGFAGRKRIQICLRVLDMKTVMSVLSKADQNLFLAINRLQTGWQNRCFLYLTNLGGICFQTVFTLVLILLRPTRSVGLKYGLIQLIVTASVQVLKRRVSRVRPYNRLAISIS